MHINMNKKTGMYWDRDIKTGMDRDTEMDMD